MSSYAISTPAFYERSRMDMTRLREQSEKMQAQLSSGQRLERSSDDPVAASRLRTLARADRLAEINTSKKDRAEADLQLADEALGSLSDMIMRIQDRVVQASNETLAASHREAIGLEMEEIHTQLVAMANSRDMGGHALFGGETTGDAYTLDGAGYAVYQGTPDAGEIELGEGQRVTRSVTGPDIFNFNVDGTATNLLTVVKDLAVALSGGAGDPVQAAKDALPGIAAAVDNISTNQTVVGARLVWLDFVADRQTNLGELRAEEEQATGGVDIAETMTRLTEAMTVLQASQAGFTRLSSLSLFDLLR